jgi:PIN domain nuclease of toxin-antitoxin system
VNLLLDTHVVLWWDSADEQLGGRARDMIADPENQIFVSAASIWEISIKHAKGKLRLTGKPSALIARNGFAPLPITPEDAELAGALAWSHTDPFDRMLVAQAQIGGRVLVHADNMIDTYRQVPQVWAR